MAKIALTLSLSLVLAANVTGDETGVSSGSEPSTVHGAPVFTDAQFGPEHALTTEELHSRVAEGIGFAADVAFDMTPVAKTYKWTKGISDVLINTGMAAVEHRNALVDADLQVIDRDVDRLGELVDSGRDLAHDPEAQTIRQRLSTRMREHEDQYSFLTKALESPHTLYYLAVEGSTTLLTTLLGDAISERLGVEEGVRLFWQGGTRRLGTGLTRTAWRRLKARALVASKLGKALSGALFDLFLEKAARDSVAATLRANVDKLYVDVLQHPRADNAPLIGDDLRLITALSPQQMIPLVQAAAPAARAIDAPQPIVLAMPARIIVHADPVARAMAVDAQLAHRYDAPVVSGGGGTYTGGGGGYVPSGGGGHDISYQPHIGGSWDGNGIGLFH